MADAHQLYQQIIHDPENDALRLAYAQAIEESEPDHAELIRVQLQIAATGGDRTLRDRERSLLKGLSLRLAEGVSDVFRLWRIHRGFVMGGTTSVVKLLDDGGSIFSRAPITYLSFEGSVPPPALKSPLLGRLTSLKIRGCALTDAHAQALSANPSLHQLRYLDLSVNHIGAAGIEALAASPHLPVLHYVDLSHNSGEDPTLRRIEEDGRVHAEGLPEIGKALEANHGSKLWISDPAERPTWM